MTHNRPLVSIGVPTFNRAQQLDRTLACLAAQTYGNLEIIVSDNGSPDSQVEKVLRKWEQRDSRIRPYRQTMNLGGLANWLFVLDQSQSAFFMWAADDDEYTPTFVEQALTFLLENPAFVAVSAEAQYMTKKGLMPFFPEGEPFYTFSSPDPRKRMRHFLAHNYGDLLYGLYRRDVLLSSVEHLKSNEIPLFLSVAAKGNWKVLPFIGLYKFTTLDTYNQVRWENFGGWLPKAPLSYAYFRTLPALWQYHEKAGRQITSAISSCPISPAGKVRLIVYAWFLLFRHFGCFVIRWKKRRNISLL
jgi:glycosyltransferase involved in cell wall biosynthesis